MLQNNNFKRIVITIKAINDSRMKKVGGLIMECINCGSPERTKEYAFLLSAFPRNVSVYTDVYNLYPDSRYELAKYARFF